MMAFVSACEPGAAVARSRWTSHCPVVEVEVLQNDEEDCEATKIRILPKEVGSVILIKWNEIITN